MKKTPAQTAFDRFSEPTLVATPQSGPKDKAPNKGSKYGRKTSLYLEPTLMTRAKMYCATSDITLTELVNECLLFFLNSKEEQKNGKKRRKEE